MTVVNASDILKKADALLDGHFLYTSGRHGAQYMQCAKVLQYPEFTEALAKKIASDLDDAEIVIAPAIGGIVWGYELARAIGAKSIFAERENGVMTLRRGFELPKGARVVVAEDVYTTGGTIREIIEIVKAHGGVVAGVGVIVDRTGGKMDLGVKAVAAYSTEIMSYTPEECPLCKAGVPLVKPGSRTQNV